MHLNFKIFKRGIKLKTNRFFNLTYPDKIWKNFSSKEKSFFLDNFAYLNTLCMPLVAGIPEINYNIPKPFFKKTFDQSLLKDIPSAVDGYQETSQEMLQRFKNTQSHFKKDKTKKNLFNFNVNHRAIIPFSCGKDSLLTLAVCHEIGLNPVPLYINDTVSPSENKIKIRFLKKVAQKHHLDFGLIQNEFEKLNDFEFWNKDEADIGYSHLILNFCFLTLPFSKFYQAKYIVLGNELDLNNQFTTDNNIKCYPSYDQSFAGTKRLNKIIKKATQNKVNVTSVISPIHDLAIMKVLHQRYPSFSRYQVSCAGLDASHEKRWCHACPDCTKFYLFMKALNLDPKTIGFKQNLFNKKFLKYHVLFNHKEKGRYEKSAGEEQLKFAYYLAYKNKAQGYVIDLFKKKFLKETQEKQDQLYKEYFSLHHPKTIPKKIRKQVLSIYQEEINKI